MDISSETYPWSVPRERSGLKEIDIFVFWFKLKTMICVGLSFSNVQKQRRGSFGDGAEALPWAFAEAGLLGAVARKPSEVELHSLSYEP